MHRCCCAQSIWKHLGCFGFPISRRYHPQLHNCVHCKTNKGTIPDFFPLTNSRRKKKERKTIRSPSLSHADYSHTPFFFGRATLMISRGFASWGTCQEKIYISQGWVWLRTRRKLQDRAEVWERSKKARIKSAKQRSSCIDRQTRGLSWGAAQGARGGFKITSKKGEKRQKWIGGRNATDLGSGTDFCTSGGWWR